MAKTRIQKEEQVKDISEKLSRSRSVIFADYQGMNMSQLGVLRKSLKDQGAQFIITKNTMLNIALKQTAYPTLPDDVMSGPIATLFAYEDEVSPIKALVKALKEANLGRIKAGYLGQELLDSSTINKLASLPSKAELQGQVVGTLAAPLLGMVNVLQANLRNLVYALDAVRKQKGGDTQ
ncbi:MAG: 50S ribosomal protein L10 [Candidatus Daviesbacteria bacterium]|nr:50S ribosomal protein L10 [Candidatus Daviesbacteria bacterium]